MSRLLASRQTNGKSNVKWLSSSRTNRIIVKVIFILLGTWQTCEIAHVYPFPLAYFNQFAGGPENGYKYLVDSNIDWGQSFIALREYMHKEKTFFDLPHLPTGNALMAMEIVVFGARLKVELQIFGFFIALDSLRILCYIARYYSL